MKTSQTRCLMLAPVLVLSCTTLSGSGGQRLRRRSSNFSVGGMIAGLGFTVQEDNRG